MALEKILIDHCAAMLVSIKTANLFGIKFISQEELDEQIFISGYGNWE
ncbi:hypothetical protein HGO97_011160 [Faecalicatena sp. AGMB00832]|uniref:Uncharacterized protein n=1 Tax=Faecalicatena faecalis TaxID=2726362 RepID=A0ABS6D577_9FIRM|nr:MULTISPECIES: hypothetical protein [Faecalicatena]MBU3876372.1 hypothetical protein [Faecalicatena faecalis]MCI6464333.1 hypothetical protein [Faecalicatena sp.]MDY5621308.1 hypothetical protein [Lachnospiraceae bacterium]